MRTRALSAVLLTALLVGGGGAAASASSRPFDVLEARIPATCGHPAARLHEGAKDFGTRPDGSPRGDASLISRTHRVSVPVRDPLVATQRGTSARGAFEAAPLVCSAGGVDHPETLVLWNRSGRILASKHLGGFARQEHADVTAVSLRGDRVHARWVSYDGAGFDVQHWAATFTLRNGHLVASAVHRRA